MWRDRSCRAERHGTELLFGAGPALSITNQAAMCFAPSCHASVAHLSLTRREIHSCTALNFYTWYESFDHIMHAKHDL